MSSESKYLNNQYKSFFEESLSKTDPDLYKAINDELQRQQEHIELIASENIVSQAVLEAQGSVLTNKYAEGYSGKRYYNGCEHVDVAENLANERLKKLFNCKFANSQPHSEDSVDYPDYAKKLSKKVVSNKGSFGILICGSGTGMSISANKTKNIRAALCYSKKNTKLSRLHNNANIITLGERLIDRNKAFSLIKIFLRTKFEGGRHLRRVKKI